MTPLMTGIVVCLGVFAAASLLYGIFRKFSQMGWFAWQLPLIFLLTRLYTLVPEGTNVYVRFALAGGILFGSAVLVLGLGSIIRFAMHRKVRPASGIVRFFDRILGGLTALLDYAVILGVIAAGALSFMFYAMEPLSALSMVWDSKIWEFFAPYAFDIFIVTLFSLAIRGGWRVGFGRVVLIFFMMALTFGALVFSFWATLNWGFLTKMGTGLGQMFGLSQAVGAIVGCLVIGFILFIILFVLLCILCHFLAKLVRHIRYSYFWGTVDSAIGLLGAFAVAAALLLGVYFVAAWVASGSLGTLVQNTLEALNQNGFEGLTGILDTIAKWAEGIEKLLTSSLISNALYAGNPLVGSVITLG